VSEVGPNQAVTVGPDQTGRASSPVWRDLCTNRAFLDERTGEQWDLFFAGLSALAPSEPGAQPIRGGDRDFPAFFNPRSFGDIERQVAAGHRDALSGDRADSAPWTYHAGTEVVSFMVYGRDPNWLSLRWVPLYAGSGDRLTIIHVSEGLTQWQEDIVDPWLAPGEVLHGASPASSLLAAALGWTAQAVTSGVLGDGAYELLKKLLS